MSQKLVSGPHNFDLRAENVRKACLSFPFITAIGLDQHALTDNRSPTQQCLGIFGRDHQTMFVKLAIPTQSLLQRLVLLGKNGGSRTIAILRTTYRLTMRLVSAHITQWDAKFASQWDSALKGDSACRKGGGHRVGAQRGSNCSGNSTTASKHIF